MEQLTYKQAQALLKEAKTDYGKAKTRDEGGAVLRKYGYKLGYKPVTKHLCVGVTADKVLAPYKKR